MAMKSGLAAGLALLLIAASPAPRVDDLGWLAGQWISETGDRWTEESWTDPRGGVMLGLRALAWDPIASFIARQNSATSSRLPQMKADA